MGERRFACAYVRAAANLGAQGNTVIRSAPVFHAVMISLGVKAPGSTVTSFFLADSTADKHGTCQELSASIQAALSHLRIEKSTSLDEHLRDVSSQIRNDPNRIRDSRGDFRY